MADGTAPDPIDVLLAEREAIEAETPPEDPPKSKRLAAFATTRISAKQKGIVDEWRRWALKCIAVREAWNDDRAARLEAVDDEIARLRGEVAPPSPPIGPAGVRPPVLVDDSIEGDDAAARAQAARIVLDERAQLAAEPGPPIPSHLDVAGRSSAARIRARWEQKHARRMLELDAAVTILRREDLGPVLAKAGGKLAAEAVRIGGALAARKALGEADPAPQTVIAYREPPPPPDVARNTHDRLWRIVRRPGLASYLARSGVDGGDVVSELMLQGMRNERGAAVYRGVPGHDLDGVLTERAWQMAKVLRESVLRRREVHFVARDSDAVVWTSDPPFPGDVPDPETVMCMREARL